MNYSSSLWYSLWSVELTTLRHCFKVKNGSEPKQKRIQLNPGWAFFRGPHKFLPSCGVVFKAEFSNKEIIKTQSIEKRFLCLQAGLCLQPGCAQAGFNCITEWHSGKRDPGAENCVWTVFGWSTGVCVIWWWHHIPLLWVQRDSSRHTHLVEDMMTWWQIRAPSLLKTDIEGVLISHLRTWEWETVVRPACVTECECVFVCGYADV